MGIGGDGVRKKGRMGMEGWVQGSLYGSGPCSVPSYIRRTHRCWPSGWPI